MEWIITSGIIALIVGVTLLLSDSLRAIARVLDRTVAYIDDKVSSVRIVAGIVLVILGGWFISIAMNYTSLWFFHLIGVIVLFFGLLYLFLPGWLAVLSRVADQIVFSTDEYVFAARKVIGIIMVIAAGYILFFTLLAKK